MISFFSTMNLKKGLSSNRKILKGNFEDLKPFPTKFFQASSMGCGYVSETECKLLPA